MSTVWNRLWLKNLWIKASCQTLKNSLSGAPAARTWFYWVPCRLLPLLCGRLWLQALILKRTGSPASGVNPQTVWMRLFMRLTPSAARQNNYGTFLLMQAKRLWYGIGRAPLGHQAQAAKIWWSLTAHSLPASAWALRCAIWKNIF